MMVALAVVGTAGAKQSPAWTNARAQLPDTASDRANPPSKLALTPVVVVPPVPPPPPIIPPILAAFTGGQTGASKEAIAAADAATVTVNAKIANAASVMVITMTAKRGPIRTANLPPRGRGGDLETTIWNFNDRYGHRIGKGNLLCRWAALTRRLCWGEIRLPRGKLIILGSSQTRTLGSFAVVGGTGFYLFKQGVLTFSALGTSKYAVRVVLA